MISFNSRLKTALFLPIFASQICLGVGCAANAQSGSEPSGSEPQQHVGYDGQSLMKGIFFNIGPAGEKMKGIVGERPSAISGKSPEEVATMLERAATEMENNGYSAAAIARLRTHAVDFRDGTIKPHAPISGEQLDASASAIIAHIEQIAPGFLETFATEIQSGDALRVQTALGDGAKFLVEAQHTLTSLPTLPAMHTEALVGALNPVALNPVLNSGTKLGGVTPGQVGGVVTPVHLGGVTAGQVGGLGSKVGHAADDLVVVDVAIAVETVAVVAIAAVAVAAVVAGMPVEGGGALEREELAGRVASAYRI